jgi:hypothetical protein
VKCYSFNEADEIVVGLDLPGGIAEMEKLTRRWNSEVGRDHPLFATRIGNGRTPGSSTDLRAMVTIQQPLFTGPEAVSPP